MKTSIKKIALVSFSALLLGGTSMAQGTDTVRVRDRESIITHDSMATPATRQPVVHDTVIKTIPPPHTSAEENNPPLKSVEIGVRYMPTFSTLALRTYNGDVVQGEVSLSNGYGFMLGVTSKHVGLQGELDYLKISQKYKDRNLDRVVDVNYLNIPILLSLNTDRSKMVNWNIEAGPQFGVNIGGSTHAGAGESTDTLRAVVAAKKGDVGLAYGTGLEFMLNRIHTARIDVGFRGFYGIVNGNAKQSNKDPNTYNVIVNASRKTYGGYLGLTFLF